MDCKTVYIKLNKKVQIQNERVVKVSDVASVVADLSIKKQIEDLKIYEITEHRKALHYIDIIKIINVITNNFKDVTVQSIGEKDTVIEYMNGEAKPSFLWDGLKVIFVCLVIFFGAAVAIMTFHTDVAMPKVHQSIYKMVTGKETEKPLEIQIPYSIGIAIGIIVFFNHFGIKFDNYPTPLEIEVNKYQEDLDKCTVEKIGKREK